MPDFADDASQMSEVYLASALAARSAMSTIATVSLTECEDCGDEIPHKRRIAVPGCTRCLECQQEFERGKR